jgi:hypothetical protein
MRPAAEADGTMPARPVSEQRRTRNEEGIMQVKKALSAVVSILAASYGPCAMAQIPNDQDNYYGDKLRTAVNVPATEREGGKPVCIPGRTALTVIGQDDKQFYVKVNGDKAVKGCDDNTTLSPNIAYVITKDDLNRSGVARTGLTYGALVVPFKYQMSGGHDFTGSASVGGYAGYRMEWLHELGVTATPIAFMGASNVSVPDNAGGTSQNVMGFTYGLGLIGTFKGAFQSGVVLGWDRVGKSVGYQYNNRPWLAIEIGYSFLQ